MDCIVVFVFKIRFSDKLIACEMDKIKAFCWCGSEPRKQSAKHGVKIVHIAVNDSLLRFICIAVKTV